MSFGQKGIVNGGVFPSRKSMLALALRVGPLAWDTFILQRIQLVKIKIKKRLIDIVAILKTVVIAYHLPIRLEVLLILQSARRLVSSEKVL